MLERTPLVPAGSQVPAGAYSHGLAVAALGDARLIFVTGQIAVDDEGVLVSEDIGEQAHFVFGRIRAVLAAAGAGLRDITKVTIFLTDITDFAAVSRVRSDYLDEAKPASTLVQVSKLVHDGCKIEVEAIALAAGH